MYIKPWTGELFRSILRCMSDTARDDYQTVESVAIEGLEDLFVSNGTDETRIETIEIPSETVEYLTVSQLVRRLKIPRSTLYRHIQAGKYKTEKGTDGKLLVSLRQGENPTPSPETEWESDIETVETVQIPIQTVDETKHANVNVDELLRKLEGATYRIGYLEAQLEAERQQVKLLMDSQHKGSWWAGFKKWFFGR